jgi:hypothetical protein
MQNERDALVRRGITLSRPVMRRLDDLRIFARPAVSLEHQHLARRYVLRGIESGGAVKDLGRYVTFCGRDGEQLPYLHPVDAIGVNGVHAVVVAPVLVRIELFRAGRTCQLLITKHRVGESENGRRPAIESRFVFRGINGFLDLDLLGQSADLGGPVVPQFWSRAGEKLVISPSFVAAVGAATIGSNCVACSHAHFLAAPTVLVTSEGSI